MEKLIIFDTTLRDGEQSPGASMTAAEKLDIAKALDAMGVDVIEAGFAASSQEDFEGIAEIARHMKRAKTCALARAIERDITLAADSMKNTDNKRIHTFISTSDIHIKHKLRSTRENVLDSIKKAVAFARNLADDVEFSAEDATRTDPDYLIKCVETAIKAGAATINLPDTVGYQMPNEHYNFINNIKKHAKGAEKVILSVHCHDDLGMAAANTLSGISAGARQAEVCVNGLGERAGSAPLEEVVMAIKTRADLFKGIRVDLDTTKLVAVSKMVSRASGFAVPRNKAIVGGNAFSHESGIHQDGMLKHRQTYEIMTPVSVGVERMDLIIGKHSGRNAFKQKMAYLGITAPEDKFEIYFAAMKVLASKQKHISDEDIKNICR